MINHLRAKLAELNSRPIGLRAPNLAGRHSRNRVFEWMASSAMLGGGVLFVLWPRAIEESQFAPVLDVVSAMTVTLTYLLIGMARIGALWCNGGCPIAGPLIRAMGAAVGAIAWVSMDAALVKQVIEVGRAPSPGIPVYTALVIAEIYSAYRAAADVRIRL